MKTPETKCLQKEICELMVRQVHRYLYNNTMELRRWILGFLQDSQEF